jgi:hypothetical protein
MTRRIYPALTPGQVAALQEAANERAAGCPEESGGLPARRYDEATEALVAGVEAEVALFLTKAEARALRRLVGLAHAACEGEPDMTRLHRTPAAERAARKLDESLA